MSKSNLTLLQRLKIISRQDVVLIFARLIMAFNTFGYIRSFTILVPVFKDYLQASDTKVNMLSGALLLGPAISALFSGVIVPQFGTRSPCILAAIILALGYWLFAVAIHFQVKSIHLLCGIYFLLCSIPAGILTSCSFINTAKFAIAEILGLVLTLQTIGATLGTLVLQPMFLLVLDFIGNDIMKMMYLIAVLQSSSIFAAYMLPYDEEGLNDRKDSLSSGTASTTGSTKKYDFTSKSDQLLPNKIDPVKFLAGKDDPEADQLMDSPKIKPKLFSCRVFFQPAYFIFTIAVCLFLVGYFCVMINLKSLYATYGISDLQMSSLFFMSGLVELVSSLFYAFMLVDAYDKIKLLSTTFCCLGLSFVVLCLPALPELRNQAELITWIGVVFYSIFSAGWSSLLNAITGVKIDQKIDCI